jgi:hypothetical protein
LGAGQHQPVKILVSNIYPTGKRRIYSSKHLLLPHILFRLFLPHLNRFAYSLHIDLPQEDETQQPGVENNSLVRQMPKPKPPLSGAAAPNAPFVMTISSSAALAPEPEGGRIVVYERGEGV